MRFVEREMRCYESQFMLMATDVAYNFPADFAAPGLAKQQRFGIRHYAQAKKSKST